MKPSLNIIAILSVMASLPAQDIPEILPPDLEADRPVAAARKGHDLNAMAANEGQVIDGSNWDDQSVADEYSKYTGQRVLLSSATQGLEIRFYQRGPLTNREAASLLVKVMDMEGYVFVPSGRNEVKLLPKAAGGTANGPGELEDIIDNAADIPSGDGYYTYLMKFDFIKPDEAVRTFSQSLHGLDPGAKLAPVANASAMFITGKGAFIRKLINQKQYIDVPAGNVENKWISMNHADAEEVAATLNEIVNASQQSNTTAGVTNNSVRRNNTSPGVTPGTNNRATEGSSSAGETIPVQIVANPRLNKIFVMGRPLDVLFIEGLARDFDLPPTKGSSHIHQLRFVKAADLFDVAVQALESLDNASRSSANAGGAAGGTRGSNSTGSAQNRNQNSGSSGSSGGAGGGNVSQFDISDQPQSASIGKSFIVADNAANRIIISGPPEGNRIVSELISQLDTRPQQVMISAVFGKITLGKNDETGVNYGFLSNDLAGGFDNNGLISPGDIDGTSFTGLVSALSGGGFNIYGAYRNMAATLSALTAKTNFEVISSPVIYAANNQVGLLSSGQRIAVPTNTITTDTGSQNTNIEFRDVLLRLEVVPLINSQEEVTLRISLLNEDVQGSQTIDGEDIPTIVTESVDTTVTVPNRAAVVLGGLITESESNTRAGVPVLSNIPGIGRLFRRDSKDVTREELLIFIQPTIVNDPASQRAAQASLESRYDVAEPINEFIAGEGVLPSRSEGLEMEAQQPAKEKVQRPTEEEVNVVEPVQKKSRIRTPGRGSQFRYRSRR